MCPIVDGQPVDAANSNPAWLDAQTDDQALGKIGLENSDVVSGPFIENTQRLQNNLAETVGLDTSADYTAEADTTGRTYGAPSSTIDDGDSHKLALTKLANKFHPTTGHYHTGAPGDGPAISAPSLAGVPLRGYFRQGLDLATVTGTSWDVSTEMSGYTPSTGILVEGVVVTGVYNKVVLKNDVGDSFEDGLGNLVYGRLTESAGVWTLSFYVDISGVETPYDFTVASDITWYFQELFNPMVNPPVYSELAIIPSDNPTQDVATATTSLEGKVLLSSSLPGEIDAVGSAGTANAQVANADHTHKGVHSLSKAADINQLFGDVKLAAGANITITVDTLNNILEIAAGGTGLGYQQSLAGTIDGVNTVFGPFDYSPANEKSILVMLDGIQVDDALWSYSSGYITLTTPPVPGQTVYVFYIRGPAPVISNVFKVEHRVVSLIEATNKSLTLLETPAASSEVMLDIVGGTAQMNGVDFSVTGSTLSWNALRLDGVLTDGSEIRITYVY